MSCIRHHRLKVRHGFLVAACLGAALMPESAQAHQRGIAISVDSIRVEDEDDPNSNDEPYLIVTKVRARIQMSGRSARIVPGTLRVTNVMSGHNNLGRRSDNWADEVRTYSVPEGTPRIAQELLPMNEPGWIVGAVVVHMEEDGFSASTGRLLSSKVRETVERAVSGMSLTGFDSSSITQSVAKKVTRDLKSALKNLNIGGIVRGLASAVDPDDFGGVNVVLAVTGPNNSVFSFGGVPSGDLGSLASDVTLVSNQKAYGLAFPAGDLRSIPSKARFQGRHKVNATIKVWTQQGLY